MNTYQPSITYKEKDLFDKDLFFSGLDRVDNSEKVVAVVIYLGTLTFKHYIFDCERMKIEPFLYKMKLQLRRTNKINPYHWIIQSLF